MPDGVPNSGPACIRSRRRFVSPPPPPACQHSPLSLAYSLEDMWNVPDGLIGKADRQLAGAHSLGRDGCGRFVKGITALVFYSTRLSRHAFPTRTVSNDIVKCTVCRYFVYTLTYINDFIGRFSENDLFE